MTTIAAAVAQMIARPAPVIIVDTCNFLDLFRRDSNRRQPREPPGEIEIAAKLLQLMIDSPDSVHLVVPELVPGEFADHANRIEGDFEAWLKFHDANQAWLAEAATWVNTPLPNPMTVHPLGLSANFRKLADDLLARAVVLDRDPSSLDRAVARLLTKRRPSQKNEIKDSMNLEQTLELCRQRRTAGYSRPIALIRAIFYWLYRLTLLLGIRSGRTSHGCR